MSKIHLPRPRTGGFLSDPLPLWCGKPRDLDTHTTSFPHLATCERCVAAQRQYVEDSEYQLMRAKRAAESEREAGVADRIHYSRNATPGITGLARAICGQWSEAVTDDQQRVTCLACLRILKPPTRSKGGAVHYLTTGTPDAEGRVQGHCRVWSSKFSTDPAEVSCLRCLTVSRRNALVLAAALAACGPLPPGDHATIGDGTTGDAVTTGSETDESSSDTSSSTTSTSASTSTETSTTGDTEAPTTGGTMGECIEPACIAAECDDGEACMPDPGTGVLTCVSPCEPIVGLCEAEVCGELVPGVCVADPLGLGWCYPS